MLAVVHKVSLMGINSTLFLHKVKVDRSNESVFYVLRHYWFQRHTGHCNDDADDDDGGGCCALTIKKDAALITLLLKPMMSWPHTAWTTVTSTSWCSDYFYYYCFLTPALLFWNSWIYQVRVSIYKIHRLL